jgi:hypothetical protein
MTNKFHSVIVRAFFILLLITGVSAAYYFWPEANKRDSSVVRQPADFPQNDSENTTNTTTGQRSLTFVRDDSADSRWSLPRAATRGGNDNIDPSAEFTLSEANVPQDDSADPSLALRMTVVVVAGTTTYPLSVLPSTTVYDAMRLLQIDSRQPFQMSAKNYPGMGYFVEEINGVKNNPTANTYWFMYVNDQSAQVGASQYILKPNDIITWKYEVAKF